MATWLDIQLALLARGIGVGDAGADGIVGTDTWRGIDAAMRRAAPEAILAAIESVPLPAAPAGQKVSAAGRAAIAQREGNKLTAYKDSVGVWTIGVGHTSAAGPPQVAAGMRITAAESDAILSRDLGIFEQAVRQAVKVPIEQHEFDALTSLAFNIGSGAFASSTLLRKLNAGDRSGAADQFLVWNKAKGKVLAGLTNRRKSERAQFLGQ